jgi:hypothetical protein
MLDQHALPWLRRMEAKSGRPDLAVRVDRAASEFLLWVENDLVANAGEPIGLVRSLIQVLDETIVRRLTTLRVVHAGAVLWHERALLFPGVTHAGKSALVAELLYRGATYYSDEYALIDAEGYVHPYPRPLLVRDGRGMQHPVLAQKLNASIGDAPAPIGKIFALTYEPNSEWNVALMSQGEALVTLLRNTPHTFRESPGMTSIFLRAVSGVECFAGSRGDAAEAVDKIIQVADDW